MNLKLYLIQKDQLSSEIMINELQLLPYINDQSMENFINFFFGRSHFSNKQNCIIWSTEKKL